MSEIRTTTISDKAGTGPVALTGQSAAKAWVNYTSTTTTAANGSFNISSLTDTGTGNTEINFTNSFSDIYYAADGITEAIGIVVTDAAHAIGSANHRTYNTASAPIDRGNVNASFQGDLA